MDGWALVVARRALASVPPFDMGVCQPLMLILVVARRALVSVPFPRRLYLKNLPLQDIVAEMASDP